MTREEAATVLAIIKAAYPASYKGMSREEANGTVALWAAQFSDVPADVVMIAVNKLISTNTFAPSISEVKSKMIGLYWESWMAIQNHKNGIYPLDAKTLAFMYRVCSATERYHGNAVEPSLKILAEGYKLYLTEKGEQK